MRVMSNTNSSDVAPEVFSYGEMLKAFSLITQRQEQQIELLKYQLEDLKKQLYGPRSERLRLEQSERQLSLLESEESQAERQKSIEELFEEIDPKPYKRKRHSKKVIPSDLPIKEEVYHPEEKICSCCQQELVEISRDIRKEVECVPAQYFMRHHVVINKACPKCREKEGVHRGVVPPSATPVIPKSEVGPGLLAKIIEDKVVNHLPLYRQSQMMEREGIFIPDKTLSRYFLALALLFEPVAKEIKKRLLTRDYLQADESRSYVLMEEKKGTTHVGQLWVLLDPKNQEVYYEYHTDRSQQSAGELLLGYDKALQTDACVAYDIHKGLQLNCNAHARRKFVDARKSASKECNHVLKLFQELYTIERKLKKLKGKYSYDDWIEIRLKMRQKHSVVLYDTLEEYLELLRDRVLFEGHPLYEAIHYTLNRTENLRRFLSDGRFEIDTNLVENRIRPFAVGRRNWLFAGSEDGARASAILLTVAQNCLTHGIVPQAYMSSVLPLLAYEGTTNLSGLLPSDWKQ